MKRVSTRWLIPVIALCGVVAIGAGLWKPASPDAPTDPAVCWRVIGEGAEAEFRRLANVVSNFESCAVRLESVYLQEKQEVVGAYQGRFIFVGPKSIDSAPHLEGARWPVFFGPQRAQIDALIAQGKGEQPIRLAPGP